MAIFQRHCKPINSNSYFLFGARGTGKTSLIHGMLGSERVWVINLLELTTEDLYCRDPDLLYKQLLVKHAEFDWVFIDEIQKAPELLNVVHRAIESREFKSPKFAMTGSSARKLKRGSANLLAGRAFVNNLYPLTHIELADQFHLDQVLNWGSLPKIFSFQEDQEKAEFLRAYSLTYLREEIWNEHLVDDLDPFRLFLEVAAQANGTIVNYLKMALDVGVNEKTVKRYFELLEETLLGFQLNAYARSVRKRQSKSPKFYLFDTGVTRALARFLGQRITPKTQLYGIAFEQFLIAECIRLNDYFRKDFRFSYFRTKDGAEIDLIIDRPGEPLALIEIKSSEQPKMSDVKHLIKLRDEFGPCETYCFSNNPLEYIEEGIHFLHWKDGLKKIGLVPQK
ncbi:MAG: DUF4143 domain-containing protein [Pseudomonadota bacterium]